MLKSKKLLMAVFIMILLTAFSVSAAEKFVIPLDEVNNITDSDKTFNLDGIDVTASMSRPAFPMKPIDFSLTFTKDGAPVSVQDVELKFNMKMDMGKYEFDLSEKDGKHAVTALLPKCMMGGVLWFGKIEFKYEGKEYEKVFFFKMTKK